MKQQPTPRPVALDPATLPARTGSGYPAAFRAVVGAREKRALGDPFGLDGFGVNLVRLPPGCWSSQRHWHTLEDELVYVLEGELVLVTDAGEQTMTAGMVAGFPAGEPNGHHLVNRSDRDAVYLEVGSRIPEDETDYPDIDLVLKVRDGQQVFEHRDGTPY